MFSGSGLEPFGEDDFSFFAACCASRALAAATVFCPADVLGCAITMPLESRSLIASCHGVTLFCSTKRSNAPSGICRRLPILMYSSLREAISDLI